MSDFPWWVPLTIGIAGSMIIVAVWHTIRMRWARQHPIGGKPFKARTHRPETPEERIDRAAELVAPGWSRSTIKRGLKDLQEAYKREGLPVPSASELRREAELLLNASINGESTIE